MNKLINTIQHYDWGSKTALTELYGIDNPENLPMAELWMGAHPDASSQIFVAGKPVSLAELISQQPQQLLGESVARRFGGLPFLFKVLCAGGPLSVQVHPDKQAAEQGYARENQAGIPLSSPLRNYKDNNHKPELVFALTPFRAMNGFRPPEQIAGLLEPLTEAHPQISAFIAQPDTAGLKALFAALLSLQGSEAELALQRLAEVSAHLPGDPWQTVRSLQHSYPADMGQFMPLLLNVVVLQPGQAMFLYAKTPHAYLQGSGLEIMANSNNVLRAGLTPKHIDIPELLKNVEFVSCPEEQLLTRPVISQNEISFPVPVDDFSFAIHQLQPAPQALSWPGPRIIFCLEGTARCQCSGQELTLQPGESAFIPATEGPLLVSGQGRLAGACCEVH
ncbi:mannose-6-phosphate isomerase [Tatumella citrea]|uniref:Mannose-6-phosphate isomerase n=1 Tax=Tatumella citrea TaxID=53336 RepID=A0A1Y0LHL1_TATCI|nr:mannose-6-phosphate isomerase [Tatumella citrea]ARU93091.1 mannose-6-phosphate isomerase [Tatumella citrea]ARU97129.1 mannose-6-phosphate isomerase [Tatumella citrea]